MARLSNSKFPMRLFQWTRTSWLEMRPLLPTRVDWRNTKVFIGEGARESDPLRSLGFDRSPSPELRQRLHDSLDRVIDAEEEGEESEEREAMRNPRKRAMGGCIQFNVNSTQFAAGLTLRSSM